MFLLGYDIGSSSVKASLVEIETGICKASAFSPKKEMPIQAAKRMGRTGSGSVVGKSETGHPGGTGKIRSRKYRYQSHWHFLPDAWTGLH